MWNGYKYVRANVRAGSYLYRDRNAAARTKCGKVGADSGKMLGFSLLTRAL